MKGLTWQYIICNSAVFNSAEGVLSPPMLSGISDIFDSTDATLALFPTRLMLNLALSLTWLMLT
jgi:hypothetical protein